MRSLGFLLCFTGTLSLHAASRTETWSGWISDQSCATGRAGSGLYTATNPDCARQCIEKGSPVVFIAEQPKAIYLVRDYPAAKDDIGYKVAVTGAFDDVAKTVTIRGIKRLERVVPSCSRVENSAGKHP